MKQKAAEAKPIEKTLIKKGLQRRMGIVEVGGVKWQVNLSDTVAAGLPVNEALKKAQEIGPRALLYRTSARLGRKKSIAENVIKEALKNHCARGIKGRALQKVSGLLKEADLPRHKVGSIVCRYPEYFWVVVGGELQKLHRNRLIAFKDSPADGVCDLYRYTPRVEDLAATDWAVTVAPHSWRLGR